MQWPERAAWIAALIYAANPNLMYMQSTAMGEAIYLAFFIWSVAFFCEWVRGSPAALTRCGLCLTGACLTRYDGWFLTIVMALVVLATVDETRKSGPPGPRERHARNTGFSPGAAIRFLLIAAAAPGLWLAYNAIIYRNPLEFENGPYSAKAIEARSQNVGNPGHPGSGNPLVAGMYALKAAEDNVAANEWLQRGWVLLAIGAVLTPLVRYRNESSRPSCEVRLDCSPSCSFLFPSTRCRSLTEEFPSSSPSGGRSAITTCVTDCSCSPPSAHRSASL